MNNNLFVNIQLKSTDSRFPLNGKLLMFWAYSVAYTENTIIINHNDDQGEKTESQFNVKDVSYIFVS